MNADTGSREATPRWAHTLIGGEVEREQLVAMIRATPWGWSLGMVGIAILYGEYGQGPERAMTLLWMRVIGCVVAIRLSAWLIWLLQDDGGPPSVTWALFILGSNLTFAACWGGLPLLLGESASLPSEGILHVTLAAVAMGGATRLAGFERTICGYVALVLAPLVVRDLWLATGFGLITGIIGLYASLSGLSLTRALRETQQQRARNAELAARLQEELQRGEAARDQLEAVGRARTHIFAAANHDLRQPLHAMGLLVQALRSLPASPEVQALAERLEGCAEGMSDVVDDLIELTRDHTESRTPRLATLALKPLIEDCCRPFFALAAAKGLHLELAVEDVGVLSDASMLSRIVANLVSNAVRYTAHGAIRVQTAREATGAVNLHVQDTGIGIATEELGRIFQPFYQVSSKTQDRGHGLGLGLATVRRFADQLHIQVTVTSTPGEGSCFTLRLTRCELPPRTPPAKVGQLPAAFTGRRVLAIEDDPAIADALQRLLQTWGCEVILARDAAEAIAVASALAPPDAVIVDLALPGGASGADVVRQLRERWSDTVPITFLTGSTGGPAVEAARATGLPLLLKPVAPARLRAFLAQALAARRP